MTDLTPTTPNDPKKNAPVAGIDHGEQNSIAGEEDPGAAVEELANELADHQRQKIERDRKNH